MAAAIRVAAGVTQQRLADEIGVHRVTLARWETEATKTPRGAGRQRWLTAVRELRDALDAGQAA
jgi:transcriptional regulator with XRE-family HTH domain